MDIWYFMMQAVVRYWQQLCIQQLIAGGQSFTSESKLTCGNGAYYMALSNGSLCIFNNKNAIVWSSMTNGSGATSCSDSGWISAIV
ncbi:MAG: hypothetical protein IPI60_18810 [Saprospiraceae bacterium]|nr:hypothetical protein [Saprospiraceae bacterium]